MKVGRRLYLARKRMEMTQNELADLTGICKTTISRYENDYMKPGMSNLIKLSDILGISLDTLTRGIK